jgi:hypothetical protein
MKQENRLRNLNSDLSGQARACPSSTNYRDEDNPRNQPRDKISNFNKKNNNDDETKRHTFKTRDNSIVVNNQPEDIPRNTITKKIKKEETIE